MLPAIIPGYVWAARKSREGASVGLAIMILLSVIAAFMPAGLGMFTAASRYFDTPWFYITGLVSALSAAHQIRLLMRFPPKPAEINGKKTVW